MEIPSAYLPSRLYFSALKNQASVIIEAKETFPKQTTRNRAFIATANGILQLSIPLAARKNGAKTDEISIDYKDKWQEKHWRAIESAYNSSPFFMYYKDELQQILFEKPERLIDYNMKLTQWVAKKMKINCTLEYSADFSSKEQSPVFQALSTKQHATPELTIANYTPYYQVFEHRQGFIPNLSAIDLLFNMGPEANQYL